MKGYKAETKNAIKSLSKIKNIDTEEDPNKKVTRANRKKATMNKSIAIKNTMGEATNMDEATTACEKKATVREKKATVRETREKIIDNSDDNSIDSITITTPEYDISITPYNTPSPLKQDETSSPCFEMQVSTNMPFTLKLYYHN
jgi:hypothetical protein